MQRRGGTPPPIKNVCLQICVSVVRINFEDFGRYVFSDTAKTFLSFEKRVNFGRRPHPPPLSTNVTYNICILRHKH